MKTEEVKKLTAEEVGVELGRLRQRLYTLRTQSVTEKVEDNSGFGKVRKDIARLLTEQRARSLAGRPSAKPVASPKPAARAKPQGGPKTARTTRTPRKAKAGATK